MRVLKTRGLKAIYMRFGIGHVKEVTGQIDNGKDEFFFNMIRDTAASKEGLYLLMQPWNVSV